MSRLTCSPPVSGNWELRLGQGNRLEVRDTTSTATATEKQWTTVCGGFSSSSQVTQICNWLGYSVTSSTGASEAITYSKTPLNYYTDVYCSSSYSSFSQCTKSNYTSSYYTENCPYKAVSLNCEGTVGITGSAADAGNDPSVPGPSSNGGSAASDSGSGGGAAAAGGGAAGGIIFIILIVALIVFIKKKQDEEKQRQQQQSNEMSAELAMSSNPYAPQYGNNNANLAASTGYMPANNKMMNMMTPASDFTAPPPGAYQPPPGFGGQPQPGMNFNNGMPPPPQQQGGGMGFGMNAGVPPQQPVTSTVSGQSRYVKTAAAPPASSMAGTQDAGFLL